MGNIETGRRGEQIAAEFLQEQGFEILARNVRFPDGEIDIVARNPTGPWDTGPPEISIVEVKTRSSTRFGTGAEAITPAKYARLYALAAQWSRANPGTGRTRVDVISILLDGSSYELEHIRGVML